MVEVPVVFAILGVLTATALMLFALIAMVIGIKEMLK